MTNPKKKYPLLSAIPGLGAGKIAKLIAQFGSESAVLSAHPSELRMCVSAAMARKIHDAHVNSLGADVPSTPETPLGEQIDGGHDDADDYAAAV